MGIISFEMEITSPIPAAKMFKAFVLDADSLIPKILPQAIKSVEILEGDGGSQYKSVKHRVDGIDRDNFTYNYSIIEGDALMGILESISYVVKVETMGDGGSICKNSSTYNTIGDAQIKEEQIKGGKQKALLMFKAVEAYLLANPDA
ncbi:hypothetical protein LguiB_025596 [Lonicera macranthoides]